MTDQPTYERELRRRALIEEVTFAFETEDGIEFADDFCGGNFDKLIHLAAVVHEDRTNPLAATAVVRPSALDTTGPDLDAFAQAFTEAHSALTAELDEENR